MTTQRIRRIDPVQAAKVMGVLYGLLGLLFAPIFFLISLVAPRDSGFGLGIGFAIIMPVLYAGIGALAMLIAAAIYNLVAGWVGGLEIEMEERAP